MARVLFVVVVGVFLTGCAADARELVGDEPSDAPTEWHPTPTNRDPEPLYAEAGSAAPTFAGSGGAGGSAAPVVPSVPAPAGAGGSGGAAGGTAPSVAGSGGAAGAPAVEAGAGGSASEAGAPAPMPAQPERFCQVLPGQRYSGQKLGCDAFSLSSFSFLHLSWKHSDAPNTSYSCGADDAPSCEPGARCRLADSRDGQPDQEGVCL